MSGPKRNPDSLNTIGVVVVGICGAVMVYVSITALQAFYMNDTSELQTMADYGGQDTTARSHKAEELGNINDPKIGTPSITIDKAMDFVVRDADAAKKAGKPASNLVPGACEQNHATEKAQPGRPVLDTGLVGGCKGGKAPATAPATGSGAGSADACDEVSCVLNNYEPACCAKFNTHMGTDKKNPKPGTGSGAGSGAADIHLHTTGSPADTHAVGGAGGAPTTGHANGSAAIAPGGHAP